MLMRHAKSDWNAPAERDHERPLNRRGVDAARYQGAYLAANDLVPHLVKSSTAVRARTTAELAMESGHWGSELELEPGFYASSVDTVLEILSGMPDFGRVMIVGHQPTWGNLVAHLTGEPTEVRTATVAMVAMPMESWGDVGSVRGSLVGVHHPPVSK